MRTILSSPLQGFVPRRIWIVCRRAHHSQDLARARVQRDYGAAAALHRQFGDSLHIQIDGELKIFAGDRLFYAKTFRSRPRLSTTTCRWPSMPIRCLLYWRSISCLPTTSPCS